MTSQTFDGSYKLTFKDFFFKVLNGSAQGIIIAVCPSAIVKYMLLPFVNSGQAWAMDLNAILVLFCSFLPIIIGVLTALQFNMRPLDVGVMAIAVGASTGSFKWGTAPSGFVNPVTHLTQTQPGTLFIASGAGDVINAMIVSGIGVITIWLVSRYLNGFGAVAIILSPLLIGGGVAMLGNFIAPYVGSVTAAIGEFVEMFTELQPLPMAILIAMAFSCIIVTPISTVGIALAISLSGLGAGAAGIGVVSTTVVLLINSLQVNSKGTSAAIFLGAMKGMMPSIFKKPRMFLAFITTAAISALPVVMFNVQGTPTSAGFGWIGMVSPIQSMVVHGADKTFMSNAVAVVPGWITWFVVPIVAGFVVNYVFTKIAHMYSAKDLKQEM